MDCYNVLKDSWYSKLGPPTPRDSLAACASQGKIYTSGGSEVGEHREVEGVDLGPGIGEVYVSTEWVGDSRVLVWDGYDLHVLV